MLLIWCYFVMILNRLVFNKFDINYSSELQQGFIFTLHLFNYKRKAFITLQLNIWFSDICHPLLNHSWTLLQYRSHLIQQDRHYFAGRSSFSYQENRSIYNFFSHILYINQISKSIERGCDLTSHNREIVKFHEILSMFRYTIKMLWKCIFWKIIFIQTGPS